MSGEVIFKEDPDYGGMTLAVRGRAAPGLGLENLGSGCPRVVRGAEPVLWGRLEEALGASG